MQNHNHIFERFGGVRPLARAVGAPHTTVHYWSRNGFIPRWWHDRVIQAAQAQNIDVQPIDFVSDERAA